jgi:hypothetical protein
MTQQNAALVEQSAAAAESLRDQAHQLARAVAVFKTGDNRTLAVPQHADAAMSPHGQQQLAYKSAWRRRCRDHDGQVPRCPMHQRTKKAGCTAARPVKPDRPPDRCPGQPCPSPRQPKPTTGSQAKAPTAAAEGSVLTDVDAHLHFPMRMPRLPRSVSISTQAPSGIWATPKALRAWAAFVAKDLAHEFTGTVGDKVLLGEIRR